MIIVLGTVELENAEDVSSVRDALIARIDRSRQDAGCISYSFATDVKNPNVLHVIEKWETEEQLDAHLAVPDEAFFNAIGRVKRLSTEVLGYRVASTRTMTNG